MRKKAKVPANTVRIDPKFNIATWQKNEIEIDNHTLISVTLSLSKTEVEGYHVKIIGGKVVDIEQSYRERARTVKWLGSNWNKCIDDLNKKLPYWSKTIQKIVILENTTGKQITLKNKKKPKQNKKDKAERVIYVQSIDGISWTEIDNDEIVKLMGDLYYDGCGIEQKTYNKNVFC